MKKTKATKLPQEIVPLGNADKEFHEAWTRGRGMLNMPHPFRAVLLGPPNVGKTTVAKSLLAHGDPAYEKLYVIHCDPETTHEYDDTKATLLAEIPAPSAWCGDVKTLVILDDLEYKSMGKIQKKNLDRLFGYVSTHKNISVILTSQDPFNVPPIVRRCSNLWVLWRPTDSDAVATVARRTGMKGPQFKQIFGDLMQNSHDSLWIDISAKTPYHLRRNGFDRIIEEDSDDEL